jgi:hypothetical protein
MRARGHSDRCEIGSFVLSCFRVGAKGANRAAFNRALILPVLSCFPPKRLSSLHEWRKSWMHK